MSHRDELMVDVKQAYKILGSQIVLNGLNMSVKKNHIYGLLGPSGCGKTVLLNSILGMRHLDSGHISLAITQRRQVGYMPQEVALFKEFTIKEIFIFYGNLFGIKTLIIEKRYKEYIEVLGLPDWDNTIGSLSGGEQRRVSFAVALLHDPELLVLDEPTVGVDSILSQRIWKYLLQLSSEGKTIIITTHYVEEARHAHSIGLMRAGVILCEDSPESIMSSHNASTLEEAFLDLSKKQDSLQLNEPYPPSKSPKLIRSRSLGILPLANEDKFNIHRFTAQLIKNLLWMKRNTLMMTFLLVLPAMQSFFYCISFGHNPKNLKFTLYSEELPINNAHDYCLQLKYNQYSNLKVYNNCSIQTPLTCDFITHLNKSMDIRIKYNMDTARMDTLQNKAWGIIYLQSNFSTSILKRIHDITLDDEDVINGSTAYITMDMSNYVVANYLRKLIIESYNDFKNDLLKRCNINVKIGNVPLKFEDPLYGSNDPVYAHSGLPGFFCSFCFYFTMIFTSGAIMMEKLVGLLDRSMVAGMTYYEVVSAHLAVQFLLMTAQKAIMLFVFYVCFDNPLLGSLPLIIALLYCIEAVGIAYGFLLTEVFASDRLVSYGGIGATLAVFSLGGIIWPLEGAHILIKSWVWAFPVVPAVDSYKMIASKGFPLTNRHVYSGFISSILWTLLLTIITIFIAKSKKSK